MVEECEGEGQKPISAGDGAGWGIVREGRVSAVLFVEEERMNEYEVG